MFGPSKETDTPPMFSVKRELVIDRYNARIASLQSTLARVCELAKDTDPDPLRRKAYAMMIRVGEEEIAEARIMRDAVMPVALVAFTYDQFSRLLHETKADGADEGEIRRHVQQTVDKLRRAGVQDDEI